jgi:vacuolar-type H+-ATPase subunit D/Vma8
MTLLKVPPTKSSLLALKKQMILLEEGYELLERKNISQKIIDDMNKKGRKPERWVQVEVEEAYMHCSKHIPFYQKADKKMQWGTDDVKIKKTDYFLAKKNK